MANNNPFIDVLREYDDQLSALYIDIEKKRNVLDGLLEHISDALYKCEGAIDAFEKADQN